MIHRIAVRVVRMPNAAPSRCTVLFGASAHPASEHRATGLRRRWLIGRSRRISSEFPRTWTSPQKTNRKHSVISPGVRRMTTDARRPRPKFGAEEWIKDVSDARSSSGSALVHTPDGCPQSDLIARFRLHVEEGWRSGRSTAHQFTTVVGAEGGAAACPSVLNRELA